jgi:hypothetical protein
MGQFKPMVKMMTTEPTVELKLKKGGHVNMKKGGKAENGHKKMADGGGALAALAGTPALIGRPAVNAPVRAPGKPSMASRRKAMMAKPAVTPSGPPMAMPPMKKGGKAEGGESKKTHMAEMSKMKGLEKELKSHESKPASKGHKGLKTGGVALGNAGGYKKGGSAKKFAKGGGVEGNGIINTEDQGGEYRNTKMNTAEYTGKSSGKTGGVKNGNGGGYATGGVALGNAGGYKAGGKTSKKAYAAGGTVDSGRPVAMPQGRKPVPSSVKISQLAGTYKNGGRATPAEARLLKNNKAENASSMRDAKAQSNLKYGSPKRFGGGGASSDNDKYYVADPKAVSDKASRELEEAMNPLSMVKELYGKARNAFRGQGATSDDEGRILGDMKPYRMPRKFDSTNELDIDSTRNRKPARIDPDESSDFSAMPMRRGQGAVTKTEKSITVSPAGKKRGGRAC